MASIKLYKTLKEARGFCTGLERVYAHEYKGGARGFATMTPEALILQIAQTGTGKSFWHECLWEGEVAGVGESMENKRSFREWDEKVDVNVGGAVYGFDIRLVWR